MIFPLEKQVPTRETCEQIRDAGFFDDSTAFYWVTITGRKPRVITYASKVAQDTAVGEHMFVEEVLPAPTAAELGALLRAAWLNGGEEIVDVIPDEMSNAWMDGENEAEARALLWLDLHEKGLLPAASCGSK